jgi:hypothetical protein
MKGFGGGLVLGLLVMLAVEYFNGPLVSKKA